MEGRREGGKEEEGEIEGEHICMYFHRLLLVLLMSCFQLLIPQVKKKKMRNMLQIKTHQSIMKYAVYVYVHVHYAQYNSVYSYIVHVWKDLNKRH